MSSTHDPVITGLASANTLVGELKATHIIVVFNTHTLYICIIIV